MRTRTPAAIVAAAAVLGLLGPMSMTSVSSPLASAAPPPAGAVVVPLVARLRACDFTTLKWLDAQAFGRAEARVGSASGIVAASVDLNTAQPNTHYDVRVIQTPRPSIGCAPGASGVVTGAIQTDGVGAGSTTLQGPLAAGATGAWVIVERPSPYSQQPAEFYTSTFIAAL